MSDRRHRPHSPSLYNPARASAPTINYDKYGELHAIPTRRDVFVSPRNSSDRVESTGPVVTHYKIKPDAPIPPRPERRGSHSRRSTLDSTSRPIIVTPARYPVDTGESGRPRSPVHDIYRESLDGDVYTIPASSQRHRDREYRRGQYSVIDNADINKLDRESGHERLLRVGSGKDGAIYPRSRPIHADTLVRHPDTVADDYGDNGYGYTNPRDLVQYDLDLGEAPRHRSRRDSYDTSRSGRPSSISGYGDITRPYDARDRERGPPPTTRGFDKIAQRSSMYDAPAMHMPMPHEHLPSSGLGAPVYVADPPVRRNSNRRPASVYHQDSERKRASRDGYEVVDDDRRDRRPRRQETFDEDIETRGFGIRAEVPPAPRVERNGRSGKSDYERIDKVDRVETTEYDERNDYDERPERKHGRDAIAAGLSIAGAALGLKTDKSSRDDEKDARDERREDRRRRDSDEERRRRREPKEDENTLKPTTHEPTERPPSRDERTARDDRETEPKRREEKEHVSKDQPSEKVDLSGRNPIERPASKDDKNHRDPTPDVSGRKLQNDISPRISPPSSRQDSGDSSTVEVFPRRFRKDKLRDEDFNVSSPMTFNAKDAMDLRALREALNKQDPAPPPIPPKEPIPREPTDRPTERPARESAERLSRESTDRTDRTDRPSREPTTDRPDRPDRPSHESTTERFDPRDPRELASIRAELSSREPREPRGRRSSSSHSQERKQHPRLVSPPRDEKKADERPVKGILKPGREKFPEDPSPIREGVAPLKDAKKDGIPPDARWTKISRKLVNPEALERGRERYEAREEFVVVLRVLSKEEVQAYATETQKIRAAREAEDDERRRRRRERHERHRRERHRREDRDDDGDHDHEHRRRRREKDSHSESETSEDERKGGGREGAGLREDTERPGTYNNYIRNPPRRRE